MLHWAETLAQADHRIEVHQQRLSAVNRPTMLTVLALLTTSGCWLALSRGRWTAVASLVFVGSSVAWFGVNQKWEGRTLAAFSPTHGLTQADLAVPLTIGSALAVRRLRSRNLIR